ncbi:hypothetical protein SAMN02745244_00719 [Tessaracoccus bendigoensis DSM 12906]|uniref:Uncharacterized protein n=1 Tax=Tessaracoccus bendigoensis DSM 12906 TaxID=1123357 RepID=A0A1M6CP44_9ACTN|nr:HGxxPAAW family protein [Tessaracoccus bendigoensis]SHI62488.1 hypothetical protein SAMN02745244_00719 [Tessaracoccus bendigoensis DSM 12906]
MARTSKFYHHGRSPAAWTGSVIAAVGFVLGAIGSVTGPNWPIAIAGGAVVLVGLLTTMVMKAMGLGQP